MTDRKLFASNSPLDLSLSVLFLEGFAFVMNLEALAQPYYALGLAAFIEIHSKRYQGKSFFASSAQKSIHFAPMKQQLSRAFRFMIQNDACLYSGISHPTKPQLAPLDPSVDSSSEHLPSRRLFTSLPTKISPHSIDSRISKRCLALRFR